METDNKLHIIEWKNIILDYYRNWGLDISVTLVHGFPKALYLNRIVVPENRIYQGFGACFMMQFLQYCDDHKMMVSVTPVAKAPAKQDAFIAFFLKFGFKHVSDSAVNQYWNIVPGDYIRLPKI